jgi:hypothetical protein
MSASKAMKVLVCVYRSQEDTSVGALADKPEIDEAEEWCHKCDAHYVPFVTSCNCNRKNFDLYKPMNDEEKLYWRSLIYKLGEK